MCIIYNEVNSKFPRFIKFGFNNALLIPNIQKIGVIWWMCRMKVMNSFKWLSCLRVMPNNLKLALVITYVTQPLLMDKPTRRVPSIYCIYIPTFLDRLVHPNFRKNSDLRDSNIFLSSTRKALNFQHAK